MLVWLRESHVDEADYLTFWSSFWSLLGTEDQASSTGKVLTMAIIPALLRVWIWRGKNVCVCVCVCVCVGVCVCVCACACACVCEERILGRETEGKTRAITNRVSVPELRLWLNNGQKSVSAQHYDVTVKSTFGLLDTKCHCFIISSR